VNWADAAAPLSSEDAGSHAMGSAEPADLNQPRNIWLAGDSTVANGNTPCPTGWGKSLSERFVDTVSVVNSAVGGRSVRTWMYEVQTEMGADGECLLTRDESGEPVLQARWQTFLDDMSEGDVLLVQFGINDGSATCDRHVGIAAFIESYGVLAQAALERGTQPVFITPVSAIACDGTAPRGTRGAFVDATFEAGEQFGVPVIDLHQRSVERYAALGLCPVAGGDVSAETGGPAGEFFCDDHTHFSQSGAVDIAGLVTQALVELDLPIARYLR
jgi:lysophospholipase L1-like esterase